MGTPLIIVTLVTGRGRALYLVYMRAMLHNYVQYSEKGLKPTPGDCFADKLPSF